MSSLLSNTQWVLLIILIFRALTPIPLTSPVHSPIIFRVLCLFVAQVSVRNTDLFLEWHINILGIISSSERTRYHQMTWWPGILSICYQKMTRCGKKARSRWWEQLQIQIQIHKTHIHKVTNTQIQIRYRRGKMTRCGRSVWQKKKEQMARTADVRCVILSNWKCSCYWGCAVPLI